MTSFPEREETLQPEEQHHDWDTYSEQLKSELAFDKPRQYKSNSSKKTSRGNLNRSSMIPAEAGVEYWGSLHIDRNV